LLIKAVIWANAPFKAHNCAAALYIWFELRAVLSATLYIANKCNTAQKPASIEFRRVFYFLAFFTTAHKNAKKGRGRERKSSADYKPPAMTIFW
jgi:hypothetical protein